MDADELRPLRELADETQVTIIAGCPIRSHQAKPYIGAFILRPGQTAEVYRKRFVHEGELPHFIPSQDNYVCAVEDQTIGVAICADISHPVHPADARKQRASVYAAGVLMTPDGIEEAHAKMATYAQQHQILCVLANYAS